MGSIEIEYMRMESPGKTDAEAAEVYAKKYGRFAVVRYKNSESSSDFTHIATCDTEEQVLSYFASPYCYGAEVLYPRGWSVNTR